MQSKNYQVTGLYTVYMSQEQFGTEVTAGIQQEYNGASDNLLLFQIIRICSRVSLDFYLMSTAQHRNAKRSPDTL